jgi:hypothetical protein
METTESKRERLKSKVLALVVDFINTEGGITTRDLGELFGKPEYSEVSSALALNVINYSV